MSVCVAQEEKESVTELEAAPPSVPKIEEPQTQEPVQVQEQELEKPKRKRRKAEPDEPKVEPQGSFKLTISDVAHFKKILEAISVFDPGTKYSGFECDFIAKADGLSVRQMDPSHVAMIEYTLATSTFLEPSSMEDYVVNCENPEKGVKFRVCVPSWIKMFPKTGLNDAVLEVTFDAKTRKLAMRFKGRLTKEAVIPTLDPATEEVPNPKVTLNTTVRLVTDDLATVISELERVSDNVRVEATATEFKVEAATELSSSKYNFDKSSEALLELETREPSKSIFNLNYLTNIVKALKPVSEITKIEFGSNMPMKLSLDAGRRGEELAFWLAPRIGEE